jgi:predicted NUDIX family NTP pyrophosphohydrolase
MARVRKPKVDKSGRTSAGILLWRRRGGRVEVLLGHPGGPYFAGKDLDHWTVLKSEVDPGEDLLEVARCEFEEETGHELTKGPRSSSATSARSPASASSRGRWREISIRRPP